MRHLVAEVFGKHLGRGVIAQAFAGSIAVVVQQVFKSFAGDFRQVCFAGQQPAHASDGILHTSLPPRGMGIAEESLDAQSMEPVMADEFGPVGKSDRPSPLGRESTQHLIQDAGTQPRRPHPNRLRRPPLGGQRRSAPSGHLDLGELVDYRLDLGGAPVRANRGDKLLTLDASALADGDCIDAAGALRAGGTACTLGGTVKAPSTLGTFLRSFCWGTSVNWTA